MSVSWFFLLSPSISSFSLFFPSFLLRINIYVYESTDIYKLETEDRTLHIYTSLTPNITSLSPDFMEFREAPTVYRTQGLLEFHVETSHITQCHCVWSCLGFVMFKNQIQLFQTSFVFIVSHFYGLEKNSIINKKSKQVFEYVTAVKITTFNLMYLIVFYVKLSSNGYLLAHTTITLL